MKRINLVLFLSILMVLIVFSCSDIFTGDDPKTEIEVLLDYDSKIKNRTNVELFADNPSNPFDFVGIMHNTALDHVATKIDIKNVSNAELFDAIKDFFYIYGSNYNYNYSSVANQEIPDLIFDEDDHLNGFTFHTYKNKYPNTNGDIRRNLFLDDLEDIVFNTDYYSGQELIDTFLVYETVFITNTPIELKAKYMVLFSIMRHSFKYWIEAFYNEAHPWHEVVKSDELEPRFIIINFTRFWEVVVDALSMTHCLSYGGLGADNPEDGWENCLPGAIYQSARAWDPGFPGP